MLTVMVVEDAPEVQRRLCDMLQSLPGVVIVGRAGDAAQATALADAHRPDVVVLDVALRDGGRGYAVLRHLATHCPQSQVAVLSNFGWGAMREGFLQAGARAYFDKALEFRKAVDWVAAQAAAKAQGPAAGAGPLPADPAGRGESGRRSGP